MSDWQRDPCGCCLGEGVVTADGLRIRAAADIAAATIGAWPLEAQVVVWDALLAAEPSGQWLLCQTDRQQGWSHSGWVRRIVNE